MKLVLVFTLLVLARHAESRSEADDRIKLQVCDCKPAKGPPGGLSCENEGFFVAAFERQGQWVAGGGAVPLSRAICCRPCLPDGMPSGVSAAPGKPLAIVSLGCHSSTDALGLRCEANANSFVSGFTEGVKVFTTPSLYPINSAQCCTPAALMDTGDAWELERCDCRSSEDVEHSVNCGANTTHELLTGFDYFRMSPVGSVVPIGPAKCCGVCVSPASSRPAVDCADLNKCSGNGVCALGRCECREGWGAADCSLPLSGGGGAGRMPPWAIALIVIGSCLLSIAILAAAAHIAEVIYDVREGGGGGSGGGARFRGGGLADGLRRPLLGGLGGDEDDAGSVGSQDTACDEDIEGVEERIEGVIHRLQQDGERRDGGEGGDTGRDAERAREGGEEDGSSENGGAATGTAERQLEGGAEAQADRALPTTVAAAAAGFSEEEEGEAEEEEEVQPAHDGDAETDELPSVPTSSSQEGHGSASSLEVQHPAARIQMPVSEEAAAVVEGNERYEVHDIEAPPPPLSEKPPRGSALDSFAGIGPLAGVDCSVCMVRPVQTVVVPCGHVCMCRRCSRRLQRCPICRAEILRRQRLFV